jgi:hypothetical protein
MASKGDFPDPDVANQLREGLIAAQQLSEGLPGLSQQTQHLEKRNQAVAG